jgi:hypothetical protein
MGSPVEIQMGCPDQSAYIEERAGGRRWPPPPGQARPQRGIEQLVAVSYCRGLLGARWKGNRLSRKTYMTVTATLFLVVAIMHLLRIIFGWQVEIGGLSIPFWVSWLALPVAGALAYFGFTQNR